MRPGAGSRCCWSSRTTSPAPPRSASTKLIHGGLRYLEHYEFRLVREALIEREVLLRIAPHIIWPLRFVLPHEPSMRPAWMIRLGLFLYDHLGGRERLPGSRGARSAPRRRRRAAEAGIPARLRLFRLLGRRCAPGRAQRHRRGRARRRDPARARAASARGAQAAAGRRRCRTAAARAGRSCARGARQRRRPLGRGRSPMRCSAARSASRAPGQGQPHRRAEALRRAITPTSCRTTTAASSSPSPTSGASP